LGTPLVKSATIHLPNGKEIEIKVNRKKADDMYVQSFTLNGQQQQRAWFEHQQIADGAQLVFDLDSTPNKSFAVDEKDAPPSLTTS
jgi:putative alpha-1,2-mannosidase